jgi:hypothetical protein
MIAEHELRGAPVGAPETADKLRACALSQRHGFRRATELNILNRSQQP